MVSRVVNKVKIAAESWVVFGSSILVLLFSVYLNFFISPTPYRDVELVTGQFLGDEYHIVANFEKTDCTFKRLTVIGYAAGVTEFLEYRNSGLDLGYDYDRDAGEQTLRIAFKLKKDFYDWVEIRTRHDCDGELVDKVFLHLEGVP